MFILELTKQIACISQGNTVAFFQLRFLGEVGREVPNREDQAEL